MRVLGQRHTADIHPEKTGNDVDRQGQHRHHRQGEQRAVALFVEVGGDFFLQQFDPFAEGGEVVDDQRKLLGGFAQLLDVLLLQPRRRTIEQAQQRPWLQRQQPLQTHQHATVGAKFGAVGRQARGEQFVFDLIDTQAGLAHDLRQHFALIAQQMHEQFRGRAKALAGLHRRAQLVHRMQRLQARADDQFAAHADPQRRHVGGNHAAEVEHHIVDHRQQRRIDMLDARRTRTFVQRFEKLLGQLQMTFHPALARGVGQVQVQPEKFFAVTVILQTAQSRRRIDLAPALTG